MKKKSKSNGLDDLYRVFIDITYCSYSDDGFPKASQDIITHLNEVVSSTLGSVYLLIGLATLIFVLYIAFGKYGNVTLGKATDARILVGQLCCFVLELLQIFYTGALLNGHSIIKIHHMAVKE